MNSRSVLYPLFWSLLVIGIVGGIVWVGFRKLQAPVEAARLEELAAATQPVRLIDGHDYYVLVKLVEFNAKAPGGGRWDRGIDIAPDPKVTLSWHGQRVYQSSTRQDTYIGTWDLFRVNIADLVRSGGDVDVASSINAPIIRNMADAPITIDVYDADVLSDDLALHTKLDLSSLHLGDNALALPKSCGVARLTVQVIDRQTSIGDLINIAQAR